MIRRPWLVPVIAVVASPGAGAGELDKSVYLRASQTAVRIEAMTQSGRVSIGTGVVVAPGRVITNCHVTHDAESVVVHRGGIKITVDKERVDVDHDLCLLSVPTLKLAPVRLGRSGDLRTGEPVVAIGYNGGYEIQYSEGVVKALYPLDGSRVIRSSTAFTSGASGGGLFDAEGKLVGVLTFRLRGGAAHYFAMPVEWFADKIGDTPGYGAVAPLAPSRIAFWQRPAAALPFFMQAASLEAGERWKDLMEVARRWIVQENTSANAWYAQGRAAWGLERAKPAIEAFERAVEFDPRLSDAWYRLGVAYIGQHLVDGARRVHRKLEALDRPLADELAKDASEARLRL